jgi:GABA(A) receptor-associated protein
MGFRHEIPISQRRAERERIRRKYPDRTPVIVERARGSSLPQSCKRKYLVPPDMLWGQLAYTVRKQLKLQRDQSLLLFVNGHTLAPACALVASLPCDEEDGFLYCTYCGESTFGCA